MGRPVSHGPPSRHFTFPIAGVVGIAGLFLAYVSELFDEYLADTAG